MRENVRSATRRCGHRRGRPWAVNDKRIVPPPKDQVYTEMEALIQHFLIYSQGFRCPRATRTCRSKARAASTAVTSFGRHRPSVARAHARAGLFACQALHKFIVGGMIADEIAVIGSLDVVMGDVDR